MSNEVKEYLKHEFLRELDELIENSRQALASIEQGRNFDINLAKLKKEISTAYNGSHLHELPFLENHLKKFVQLLNEQTCHKFSSHQIDYLMIYIEEIVLIKEGEDPNFEYLNGKDFTELDVSAEEKIHNNYLEGHQIEEDDIDVKKVDINSGIIDEKWKIFYLQKEDFDHESFFSNFDQDELSLFSFKNFKNLLDQTFKDKPHLILVSKNLINIEKIKEIKEIDQELPVILTGKTFSNLEIMEAINFGVNNFLKTPTYPNIVFGVCADIIKRVQILRALEKGVDFALYHLNELGDKINNPEIEKLKEELTFVIELKAQLHTQSKIYKAWKKTG